MYTVPHCQEGTGSSRNCRGTLLRKSLYADTNPAWTSQAAQLPGGFLGVLLTPWELRGDRPFYFSPLNLALRSVTHAQWRKRKGSQVLPSQLPASHGSLSLAPFYT